MSGLGYRTVDGAFAASDDYPISLCLWHWTHGTETPVSGDATARLFLNRRSEVSP